MHSSTSLVRSHASSFAAGSIFVDPDRVSWPVTVKVSPGGNKYFADSKGTTSSSIPGHWIKAK